MNDVFYSNSTKMTFLDELKECLKECKSFTFSVSFIKKAGLVLLEKDIVAALNRGAQGRVLTSTYQNFTDISSLEFFLDLQSRFDNFECHLDLKSFGDVGFHTKGYLFEFDNAKSIIIGSSNITRFALLVNKEWDIKVTDSSTFNSYQCGMLEFNYFWSKTEELSSENIKKYGLMLNYAIEKWDMDYIDNDFRSGIKANLMQKKALKELRRYRDMGVNRALIIAATGSGKTYLAALDARNFDAKRLLFVVHREQILIDARNSFKTVFGSNRTYGLFTGNTQELDCDFIFTTNIMLAKHSRLFCPTDFDYVVMDECQHATTNSYSEIINYFKPEFMIGLTATPERMDNEDVFGMFDKNVPFELRLRDAIENDLVVPFRYYGIRDSLVDYNLDEKDRFKLIEELTSKDHCVFVKNEILKHPVKGKLKAIGFCRTVAHAQMMAEEMNQLGLHCRALSGNNDTGERIKAFNDLQDESNSLEIIFTVDILNEGVDVPAVNMVLFLRPTQSQTIFIQQLGRGLRKCSNKDYLTVLDFIGNSYERSVQIALALSTLDKTGSMDKKQIERLVQYGTETLPKGVEIFIDEESQKEILSFLEKTNFNRKDYLISDYMNYKKYLGLIGYPSHMDYISNECAPDLLRFMKAKINGRKNVSYYNFLRNIKEENIPLFSKEEEGFINYLSEMVPLFRPDEFYIIQCLLSEDLKIETLGNKFKENYRFKEDQFKNALGNLTGEFLSEKEKSEKNIYVEKKNELLHLDCNKTNHEFLTYIKDLLDYGLTRCSVEFGDFDGNLKLYSLYSTYQFMLAINQKTTRHYKGTLIDGDKAYLLVGLRKDANIAERINYKDKFINNYIFQWESETGCTLTNAKGKKILNCKEMYLFVRKMEEEDGITMPYLYVGKVKPKNPRMSQNSAQTILFDMELEKEIPEYLCDDLMINIEVGDDQWKN